jgi:hypothetical protein
MSYLDALGWTVFTTIVTAGVIFISVLIGTLIYDNFGKKGLIVGSGVVLSIIAFFNLVALFIYFVIQ